MNIAEILKNVPIGTKLYATVYGEVEFCGIRNVPNYPIYIKAKDSSTSYLTKEGKLCTDMGECILFPSKINRNWNNFRIINNKRETKEEIQDEVKYVFQPFEQVIVRANNGVWTCDIFSHERHDGTYVCIGGCYPYCLPYNNKVEKLIGTKNNI